MTESLSAILARVPEQAVPDRLAAVHGVVRFEATDPKGRVADTVGLRIAQGAVIETDDEPDVTIRCTADVMAGIVAGERNAGLEYLRGSLDLRGDAELALAVGGLFREPGTQLPVDPRALDPVEVARLLGQVKRDHLERVMRSGFRDVVLGEIFRRLPEYVNPRKAARTDLTIAFRLTGHPSGEVERYVVTVRDGTATVTPGEAGERSRDATVTCEGHDFLRLATGHLNPVFGVLRGHLKVKGDQAKALQLSSVIDIPQAS
ncbi:MAG: SCP2 sterol-binding domain-containing protein [Nocardioides sp.]